jgi:hypothetical protein
MMVSAEWLEEICRDQGPRWPGGLDRPWARRRLLERLGDRLRWVETRETVGDGTTRALDAAGVTLHVVTPESGSAGPETNTSTVH